MNTGNYRKPALGRIHNEEEAAEAGRAERSHTVQTYSSEPCLSLYRCVSSYFPISSKQDPCYSFQGGEKTSMHPYPNPVLSISLIRDEESNTLIPKESQIFPAFPQKPSSCNYKKSP